MGVEERGEASKERDLVRAKLFVSSRRRTEDGERQDYAGNIESHRDEGDKGTLVFACMPRSIEGKL
jgi:hypothetical protein